MPNIFKSRNNLIIGFDQGIKSDTDKKIYWKKELVKHYPTLEEIAIILSLKCKNEEEQYPSSSGYRGWKKPLDFVTECIKYYVDDSGIDLNQLIIFLEKKYQVLQFKLFDGWVREQTKTAHRK